MGAGQGVRPGEGAGAGVCISLHPHQGALRSSIHTSISTRTPPHRSCLGQNVNSVVLELVRRGATRAFAHTHTHTHTRPCPCSLTFPQPQDVGGMFAALVRDAKRLRVVDVVEKEDRKQRPAGLNTVEMLKVGVS